MIPNLLDARTIYRAVFAALIIALAAIHPHVALAKAYPHQMSTQSTIAGPLYSPAQQMGDEEASAVYVLTNQVTGNGVAIFNRSEDGSLSDPTVVPTGGLGIGTSIASQGSIMLSEDGQWLFAVNAGSNEISVFAVSADGLELTDKVASGGVRPNSIATHGHLLYVLNAGASGNISGFWLNDAGQLNPIEGSTRHVSNLGLGNALLPAQVSFDPTGKMLVVTERESNMIVTYEVAKNGLVYGPTIHESAGMTPYGFAFTPEGTLVVSEAFGGEDNASAVSSYAVSNEEFTVISPSVATEQTAACWLAVSHGGDFAYSANAASSSISSYSVGDDGSLTLLDSIAGPTGEETGPLDLGLTADDQYLYVLSARSQSIIGFAVQADGSLEALGAFGGLPMGAYGLAVR